jgi:hypothetical protein
MEVDADRLGQAPGVSRRIASCGYALGYAEDLKQ